MYSRETLERVGGWIHCGYTTIISRLSAQSFRQRVPLLWMDEEFNRFHRISSYPTFQKKERGRMEEGNIVELIEKRKKEGKKEKKKKVCGNRRVEGEHSL